MLLAVTVGDVVSHLDGRFVAGKDFTDGLVEHFMVGGLGRDPGDLYFRTRENKAVIIRGDRPDIQMSALTTPTKCILLTKGIKPIEYVKYEAEREEVPLVVVEPDTLTTMDLLNTLQDGAQFDHPAKVERLGQLLTEHLDLPAVYAGLGLAA
jgi:BioD-like phosphotransacetylase family protein